MTRTFRNVMILFSCLLTATVLHAEGADADTKAQPPVETPPVLTYSISTDRSGCRIDWQAGQLEAVGQAFAQSASPLDMQQARVTAYGMVTNEARQGVLSMPLDATTTLAALQTDDEVRRAIDAVLGNLVFVDECWNAKKRTYTVVGVLPLYGERGVSMLGAKIAALATPAALAKAQMSMTRPMPRGATPQRFNKPYSGVIINADKVLLTPCLFPRLLRFDGKEFWGPSLLTPEAITAGPVRYARNLQTALKGKLAGSRPLVLEAVGAGQQCYPVFNVEDVMRALTEHKAKGLLSTTPIIITLGQK